MPKPLVVLSLAAAMLCAAPQAKKQPPAAKPAAPALVDINEASVVELKKLPGIPSLLARKIVANRPYRKVDDLVRAGVPKETIEKIRPLVTADDTTSMDHPRRRVVPPAKPPAKAKKS